MPDVVDAHPIPDARSERKLRITVTLAVSALIGFCIYRGWNLRGNELVLGIACVLLAVWPAIRWVRTHPYRFPAFEAFMLTIVTAYVLPLVNEHAIVAGYSDEVVSKAMTGVIIFQACAIFAFLNVHPTERVSPFWTDPLFRRDIGHMLPYGIWLHVGYLITGTFTDVIPGDIDSVLRAVFFGISTSCTFLLARYWADGQLASGAKANVFCAIALEVILELTTLYLITAISGMIVFFLAFISAGRRVPWITLGILFLIFSILHNGKTEMREKYWGFGAPAVAATDMPAFFAEWVEDGLKPPVNEDGPARQSKLLDRVSLLQMLCLVVDSTDQRLPFLMGETYGYVVPQLVPRVIWPDKPSGQLTSSRLAIYFGLQDEDSTRSTSIAFGALAEAYANYGFWGMAGLGLLVGWAAKVISIWTRSCPLLSNGGLIMILVMAWSIQIELPMSVWVASLYQAAICVLAIPFVLRFFFS